MGGEKVRRVGRGMYRNRELQEGRRMYRGSTLCEIADDTYSYADMRHNAIASPHLLATRIVGHPFKFESHRLGLERSEDMLSWNVFRSLQEAGCLRMLAQLPPRWPRD